MCNGWIKLHRKILDWEWFSSPTTLSLFINFLFKANINDKKWRGMVIKRGQFVTSRSTICAESGLTPREYRTAIKRLVECGAILTETTNAFTLVTICNYESYQQQEVMSDQQKTNERPTSDQQKTNERPQLKNIRIEEDKEELSLTNVRESEKKVATVVATPPQELMKARLDKFYKSLIPYVETYGREMVRDFYNYWSEPNKSKTKFRAELQPTWDVNRRLATWAKYDSIYGRANNSSGSASTREQRTAEFLAHVQERLEQPDDYAEKLPWEE